MSRIQQSVNELNKIYEQQHASFEMLQRLQFDWLQGIAFQLDLFSGPSTQDGLQTDSPLVKRNSIELRPISPQVEKAPTQLPSSLSVPITPPREIQLSASPLPHVQESKIEASVSSESETETSTSANISLNSINRCQTAPVFGAADLNTSTVRFVDDDSLLLDSDDTEPSSDIESSEPLSFNVQGSLQDLTQSASNFREKWREMLDMKKSATFNPKNAPIFAFDDDDGVPESYKISDSEGEDSEDDDDIYERNPVEIHGKMIPIWARGDQLFRQLKRQQRTDPDSIFCGFTADCNLPDIFNAQKPRWEQRQDSGWWDSDRVTDEEVAQFKSVLGIE